MKLERIQPGIIVEWLSKDIDAHIFFDCDMYGFDELECSTVKAEIQSRSHEKIMVDSSLVKHGMIGIICNPAIIKCFQRMSLAEAVTRVVDAIIKTKI